MKKTAIALGAAALLTVGMAAPAVAKPADTPKNEGAACVQAGIGTLKELGVLQLAAKKQYDYQPLGSQEGGAGLIGIEFGEESVFLPLGQVVKLHTTNPELFAWCR